MFTSSQTPIRLNVNMALNPTCQIRYSRIKHPRPGQPFQLHLMNLTMTMVVHRHLDLLHHASVQTVKRRPLLLPLVPVEPSAIGVYVVEQARPRHEGVLGHLLTSRRNRRTPAPRRRRRDASRSVGRRRPLVPFGQQGVNAEGALVFLDLRVHVERLRLVGVLVVREHLGGLLDEVGHFRAKRVQEYN